MSEIRKSQVNSGLSELENTFREYKNKLEQAENEANEIVDSAWKKAEAIIAKKNEEAQSIVDGAKQKARIEYDRILSEAKTRAAEVDKEANTRARKDAKEKTRKEVENIIADAKKSAELQSSGLIAKAKEEAENIVKGAEEASRKKTFEESETLIGEAREKARRMDEDSVARAVVLEKLMIDISKKTDEILLEVKKEITAEMSSLAAQLNKARCDLELKGILDREASAKNEGQIPKDNGHVTGRRELNILPPYEINQVKRFMATLKQIPNLKLDGEAGNEDSYSVFLNIAEPIPLHKILQGFSSIESVADEGKTIIVRLRTGSQGNDNT